MPISVVLVVPAREVTGCCRCMVLSLFASRWPAKTSLGFPCGRPQAWVVPYGFRAESTVVWAWESPSQRGLPQNNRVQLPNINHKHSRRASLCFISGLVHSPVSSYRRSTVTPRERNGPMFFFRIFFACVGVSSLTDNLESVHQILPSLLGVVLNGVMTSGRRDFLPRSCCFIHKLARFTTRDLILALLN